MDNTIQSVDPTGKVVIATTTETTIDQITADRDEAQTKLTQLQSQLSDQQAYVVKLTSQIADLQATVDSKNALLEEANPLYEQETAKLNGEVTHEADAGDTTQTIETDTQPSSVTLQGTDEAQTVSGTGTDSVTIQNEAGDGYIATVSNKNPEGFDLTWQKVGNGLKVVVRYTVILGIAAFIVGGLILKIYHTPQQETTAVGNQ